MADIEVTMGLNNTQFNQALNQSEQRVSQFTNSVDHQTELLANAFKALSSVIAGIGIGEMIKSAGELAGEIVKVSQATGLSVQSVKGWQDALVNAGGEADNTRDALLDLNNKMAEATQGGGSLLTAFNQVGVSLADLQSKSQQDIMQQVVKGLADTQDGATRTSLAMQLMGEDVKTVDFRKVNNEMAGFIDNANRVAPSLIAARNAQQEFNKTYQKFLDEITIAIPWDELASGIKTIGDNLDEIVSLTKAVAELGGAFLLFSRVLLPLEAAIIAAATSTAGYTAVLGVLSGVVTKIIAWFAEFRSLLLLMGPALVGVTGGVQTLTVGLGALFALATRLGVIVAALYAINEASSIFSKDGNTISDWAEEQAKAIGLIDETSKEEEARKARMKKASEDALAAMDKENKGRERQSQFLNQSIQAMNDMVKAYRDHNNEILKGIQNDTAMIGMGEEQVKLQQSKNQLQADYLAKQDEINKKIAEGGDPSIVAQYQKALIEVNNAYKEQSVQIEAALKAQIEKERIDRASTFTDNELANAMGRINDLNNESAKMFLPLVEQKYKDIEYAANKAAEAEIAAEAARRGVSPDELKKSDPGYIDKIVAGANAKVEAEKASVKENERLIELKDLENFKNDTLVQSSKELQDIYSEMARSTMPELAAKQQEIVDNARAKAKAEIEAENARRGSKMSAAEEREYYKAAIEGTRGLLRATEESYNMSREWSTGWTKAMNQYIADATNGAEKAQQIFTKAMNGMEDALVNFAKTGKFEWKGFLSSMLEELLRAQIQAVFASILGDMTGAIKGSSKGVMDWLGGALSGLFGGDSKGGKGGGIFDGVLGTITDVVGGLFDFGTGGILGTITDVIGGLFGGGGGNIFEDVFDFGSDIVEGIGDFFDGLFANGGNISSGKWGIAGEAGPEIVTGPATVIPLNKLGGGGTNVTYNINAVDALSFKQMIAADPSFLYGVVAQGAKGIARR